MKNVTLTKRNILGVAHSFYDPPGIASPFTIKMRIMMKKLFAKMKTVAGALSRKPARIHIISNSRSGILATKKMGVALQAELRAEYRMSVNKVQVEELKTNNVF